MNTPLPPADGPGHWRDFGEGWTLTTRDGGAQVVLDCQATWTTREPLTCRLRTRDPATGLLVELTPESNVAKRIESVPLLEEAVRALLDYTRACRHAESCAFIQTARYAEHQVSESLCDCGLLAVEELGRRALGMEGER